MSPRGKWKVTGGEQTKRAIGRLREAPQGAALDAAIIDGLEIHAGDLRRRAPRPSLRAGVRIKRMASRGRTFRKYWVAYARGLAMRIAHLVELGTAPHSLAKGASRRYGIMQDVPPFHPGTAPEPFHRPSFESTKEEVVRRIGQNLWEVMVASIRRGR